MDAQLPAGAGGLRALTLLLLPSTEPRRPALRPRLRLSPFRRAQPANAEAAGAGGPVPHPLLHVSRWVGVERPAGAQGGERVVALGRAGAWGPPACWAATVVWANPAQATQENPDPRVPSCVPVMAGQVPPPAVPQEPGVCLSPGPGRMLTSAALACCTEVGSGSPWGSVPPQSPGLLGAGVSPGHGLC